MTKFEGITDRGRWLKLRWVVGAAISRRYILETVRDSASFSSPYFSDSVISNGILFTKEFSSKSLHLPIRPWHSVSHLISTIFSNYTSHHELSVLQPSNFSKYHVYWFWSARLQLQLSCNMEFYSYLHQNLFVHNYEVSSLTPYSPTH